MDASWEMLTNEAYAVVWWILPFFYKESILTLYMAISGGVSWIEPLQPLREVPGLPHEEKLLVMDG